MRIRRMKRMRMIRMLIKKEGPNSVRIRRIRRMRMRSANKTNERLRMRSANKTKKRGVRIIKVVRMTRIKKECE